MSHPQTLALSLILLSILPFSPACKEGSDKSGLDDTKGGDDTTNGGDDTSGGDDSREDTDDSQEDTDDTSGGDECLPGTLEVHLETNFRRICAGSFRMGSPGDEVGRFYNEDPHTVSLTRDFLLSETEVTQAQFEARMGYQPSTWSGCDLCPVETLSWHEAAAYANALSDADGLARCYSCAEIEKVLICSSSGDPYECAGYRLPTESEWEYGARAGIDDAFSNGGNLYKGDEQDCGGNLRLDNGEELDELAVYCGDDLGRPSEVGSLHANPWGLFDVHGNVQEWSHDWWDGATHGTGPVVDPCGATDSSDRTLRGGSWESLPWFVRSAARTWLSTGITSDSLGFRLARSG